MLRLMLLAAVSASVVAVPGAHAAFGGAQAGPAGAVLSWEPTAAVRPDGDVAIGLDVNGQALAAVQAGGTTLYRSSDGGASWSAGTPVQVAGPLSVESSKVALGRSGNGDVARTTDGGRTWRVVEAQPVSLNVLSVVAASRDGRGSLSGRWELFRLPTPGFCERWDGGVVLTSLPAVGSPVVRRLPVAGAPVAADVLDQRRAVVVVHEYGEGSRVSGGCWYAPVGERYYATADGGRTWRLLRRVPVTATDAHTTAVELLDDRRLVAGRSDGSTLASRDGGATYAAGAGPATKGYVTALSFAGARGFALTDAGLWRSVDAGRTWTVESSAYSVLGSVGGDVATSEGARAVAGAAGLLSMRTTAAPGVRAPAGSTKVRTSGLVLTKTQLEALWQRRGRLLAHGG